MRALMADNDVAGQLGIILLIWRVAVKFLQNLLQIENVRGAGRL